MTDAPTTAITRTAWRSLAVGAAGFVLFGFNSTATNLAFADIRDTFDSAPEASIPWIATGYFIASAAFLPVGGRLADRLGRKKVFNLGLIGFMATAALSALAPSVWVLIAARSLQAVAGALIIPASLSMALPQFPPDRRSTAVATWASAGPLSAALAPSIAAILLTVTDWRAVYLLSAPIAAIILVLSIKVVPESVGDQTNNRLDVAGTAIAIVAIALLIVGISLGPDWGWTGVATISVILEAVALGVAFVIRSSNQPAPLLNLELFKIPEVAVANLANLFISITSLSIWLVWPLWLGNVRDYEIWQIGAAITVGPMVAGPATIFGGRLAERVGHRIPMVAGTAIATSALLWSVFSLNEQSSYVTGLMPTIMGFGLGWGLSHPQMNSWALAHVDASVFGEVNAVYNTVRNLGAAVGTAGALTILANEAGGPVATYQRANMFFAGWVGLSCVTVWLGTSLINNRRRLSPSSPTQPRTGAPKRPLGQPDAPVPG